MTEKLELKDRIRDFIVSWDNTIDDEFMGLADYIYQTIGENK